MTPTFSVAETVDAPNRVRRCVGETPYWMQASGTPGMAIALIEEGKTRDVLAFGSTDGEGKQPVTEATVFQAASLSKQALLYAVLKTIEARKLDTGRPLAEYMEKPYGIDDPELGLITTRHVLTHTTGWPNWPDRDKPIRRIGPPGTKWGYSGAGFAYLQTVLESIWGESAAHYTRRLVLDPLGMSHSSFVWLDEYETTASRGFDPGEGSFLEFQRRREVNGASSLHTTAREYALLIEACLSRDLRDMHPEVYHRQVEVNARLGWSLGWGTAGDAVWQWGDNGVFKAFSAIVPTHGLGLVVLTNSASGQRVNREWVNAWLGRDFPAFYFKNVSL